MKDALELFSSRFSPPSPTEGGAVAISSLTGAADAFLALALSKGSRLVLAATSGLPDADRLSDDLRVLSAAIPSAREVRVLEFPPPLAGDVSALGTRLKTLAALRAWPLSPYPCVLVVSSPALASPVPTGAPPVISLGTDPTKMGTDPIKFSEICEKLATFGYNRVPMVEQVGDFSVRGGIVDAWSPGEEFPIRAEFFGDDLESIRTFDAATQMSIERVEKAALLPAGSKDDEQDKQCSLLDLLPDGSTVLALEHNDYSLPVPRTVASEMRPYQFTFVYTGDPAPRGVPTGKFQTTPLPGFAELGADEAHHPELFDAARGRLERPRGRQVRPRVREEEDTPSKRRARERSAPQRLRRARAGRIRGSRRLRRWTVRRLVRNPRERQALRGLHDRVCRRREATCAGSPRTSPLALCRRKRRGGPSAPARRQALGEGQGRCAEGGHRPRRGAPRDAGAARARAGIRLRCGVRRNRRVRGRVPIRGDARPGRRDSRRQEGPRGAEADGPPHLRRRGLRQDGSRDAGRLHSSDERQADGCSRADHGPCGTALRDLHLALRRDAHTNQSSTKSSASA